MMELETEDHMKDEKVEELRKEMKGMRKGERRVRKEQGQVKIEKRSAESRGRRKGLVVA